MKQNSKNKMPGYLSLLARHFSVWMQIGGVLVGDASEDSVQAYSRLATKSERVADALLLGARLYGVMFPGKALRRFVQEHSFQRMVVSPAKLRSLYRSRHAHTNQQAIDALREGYPNLCPAEGAKMKLTALAKYLKLPVGRVM